MRCGPISTSQETRQVMHKGTLQVGTSGYSFDDWYGAFYPDKLPKTKMLEYYAQFFKTVEINMTYYRIPTPKVFEGMLKKTRPEFTFFVKTHESLTHKRNLLTEETPKYLNAIQPFTGTNRLKGLLAQFPYSFHQTQENIDHLKTCRDLLKDYNLFVEFRHSSWIRQEIFDLLRTLGIGYVSVDEPQLDRMVPPVAVATIPVGYVRFHGRNADKWYSGTGSDRYDYLYSESELREWVGKIDLLRSQAKEVFLFFNNCHQGQAVTNAQQILEMLDNA